MDLSDVGRLSPTQNEAAIRPRLSVGLARGAAEVEDAQRLRYKVFAEEMHARLDGSGAALGLDIDGFDAHCDHIVVRDEDTLRVVGTYRVLPPHAAQRVGRLYSDSEFDLARLLHLRAGMIEVGRSCVHPDYRSGATIALLWAGLAEFVARHDYRYVIGCASLAMTDGGHAAAAIYRRLAARHLSPVEYRVFPRCELPLDALDHGAGDGVPPALVKGYLRVGAMICGAPAWDPDFNTADLLMLLPVARMDGRR